MAPVWLHRSVKYVIRKLNQQRQRYSNAQPQPNPQRAETSITEQGISSQVRLNAGLILQWHRSFLLPLLCPCSQQRAGAQHPLTKLLLRALLSTQGCLQERWHQPLLRAHPKYSSYAKATSKEESFPVLMPFCLDWARFWTAYWWQRPRGPLHWVPFKSNSCHADSNHCSSHTGLS